MKRLNLDIDKNLTANSNILASSQQALKYYIDQKRVLLNYLQATEPTSFSIGEKWLNTSSNKIFTALSSSTWDNGIDLELGQIYSFNNLLYHWDGENLLIYSSGSITETHNNTEVKTWVGTQSEYDAIVTKDPTTEYVITDAYSNLDIILANQTEFNNSSTTKAATPYQVNQKIGNYLPLAGGNLNAGAILRLTNTNNEVTPLAFNTSGYLTVGSKLYVNTETNTNTVVVRSGNIYKVNTSGATALWSDALGVANGIATLDANIKIPTSQLPLATASTLGAVQPDGNTITIDANGVITAIGGGGGGGGDVSVDNVTIVKNSNNVISTIAVREQRNSQAIKEWVGTKAQYDALNSKDSNTKYIITDDEGSGIVVDNALSTTSANPVENRVITNAIQNMAVAKTRIVGELVESTIPLTDAGLHLLDGSVIIGNGVYSEFVTYMAGLVNTHPEIFTTETDWQNSVSEFGVCNKYVYDSQDNSIRLPNISTANRYLIDSYKDGTSWYNVYSDGWCEQGGLCIDHAYQTINLFKTMRDTNYSINIACARNAATRSGDANDQIMIPNCTTSSIYVYINDNNNNYVYWEVKGYIDTTNLALNQIYEYVVIATTSNTQVEVDINEIISDLNTKVSTGDLDEVQCIVETYNNGTSWYRVYSDGWCEQGGYTSAGVEVQFLKQFRDTNYTVIGIPNGGTSASSATTIACYNKTATGVFFTTASNSTPVNWEAKGYIS